MKGQEERDRRLETEERGQDARIPFAKKRCFSCTNHPWYALFVASTLGTGTLSPRCANAFGNLYLQCRKSFSGRANRDMSVGWPTGALSWRKPTSLHLQKGVSAWTLGGLRTIRWQGTYTIHHHERAALLTEMSVNSFLVESYEPQHVLRSRDQLHPERLQVSRGGLTRHPHYRKLQKSDVSKEERACDTETLSTYLKSSKS